MERISEMPTSKLPEGSSLALSRIVLALTQMAIYRRASMDEKTLQLYASRLATERFDDVIAAIETIQEMPREAGETALPEIGAILAMVKVRGISRVNREATADRTVLARWQCPECGVYASGYIRPDDADTRYCRGIPKREHKFGEHCSARMREVYRA